MLNVQNQECIRRISRKSLWKSRRRNFILCIAIALTTILLTALFTISGSMLEDMQQSTMYQVGTKAHAGFKFLSMEQYETVCKNPRVKDISYDVIVGTAENKPFLKDYTEVRYTEEKCAQWGMQYPTTGRLPQEKYEVAVATTVLEELGVPCELGSEITLQILVGSRHVEQTFTVCGYWEKPAVTMPNQVFVSREYQEEVAPLWEGEEALQEFHLTYEYAGAVNASLYFDSAINIDGQMQLLKEECGFGEEVNDGVNWAYSSAYADAGTALLLAGLLLLIMLSGYLIIYNIFAISVSADIRYYGLLKTIGTTNRQLRRIVHRQAWYLSCIGIPAGLLLGYGLSALLLPIIAGAMISISWSVHVNPLIFLLSALFAWITVWISCIRPCRFVNRISPMEALRYQERDNQGKRKKGKTRTVTPLRMAWANLARNKRKSASVVLSISLSVILLNVTVTLVSGFDMDKYLQMFAVSDYYVTDQSVTLPIYSVTETESVGEEELAYLRNTPGLTEMGCIYMAESEQYFTGEKERLLEEIFESVMEEMIPEEIEYYQEDVYENHVIASHIYGVDELPFEKMDIMKGSTDWEKFKTGQYAIVSALYDDGTLPYYQPGEKIQVSFPDGAVKEYEVMALGDVAYALGPQHGHGLDIYITLPTGEFLSQMPDCSGAMKVAFNVEPEKLMEAEEYVSAYCGDSQSTLDYASKLTYMDDFEEFRQMYLMVGGALSFILGIIGVLNFVNLTATSIQERKNELAILQSVGMTGRQLRAMLMGEGLFKILITVIFVLTAGMGICYGLVHMMASEMWMFTYHFVVWPVLVSIPVLLLLSVLIPDICCYGIGRKPVVERLREMN